MKTKTFASLALAATLGIGGAVLVAQQGREANPPAAPAAPAPAAPAVDPDKVVISMNGAQVTAREFEDLLGALSPQAQALASGPMKRELAEEIVKLKLLAREAEAQKLHETPKFKSQMQLMRDNMLASMYMQDREAAAVKDEDVQAYFDANKGKFDRVVAQHILIASAGRGEEKALEEATKIRKQLDEKGADFGEIAKKTSEDPGSKEEGGLLPAFGKGEMVPEFEAAAFALQEGQISQPVKSAFGYHIIKLNKREPADLNRARRGIVEQMKRESLEKLYADLRAKADVKLDEQYFPTGR